MKPAGHQTAERTGALIEATRRSRWRIPEPGLDVEEVAEFVHREKVGKAMDHWRIPVHVPEPTQRWLGQIRLPEVNDLAEEGGRNAAHHDGVVADEVREAEDRYFGQPVP